MRKVVVIGGGASGLFASYASACKGNQTILLEKNEKLGKKIYITGKGRCNLTSSVSIEEFFNNVVSNPKFLYSAINNLSPKDTMLLFENNGLKLKIERGNRVFPLSDKASDVTKTMERLIVSNGVDVRLNTTVNDILIEDGCVKGVNTDKGKISCDSVIICTGGISYPLTGSTGDGYRFAKELGHSITDIKPALVGIELVGNDFLQMQGLALKNVKLTAKHNNKSVYEDFGELLFTHFGISGPIVLSCSSKINKLNVSDVELFIDLKPALDEQTLDKRLLREFAENNVKNLSNVMRSLLPSSLINCVMRQARLYRDKKCCEITAVERRNLLFAIKSLSFRVSKLRPVKEAIITSGGVNVKEISPKTMESKLIKGLFFAGEVLDVDAFTGGFNLQLAFSTGYTAGLNS
ncbi:MAG: NAD(P)/FAD-dependent oxidoreductase [Clostridiales bacterium]|nr:NAD(P)/FAD-dependent oxidoreductase [Clostridiales bacterium]